MPYSPSSPELVYCSFWLLFLIVQLARASILHTLTVVPYSPTARDSILYTLAVFPYNVQLARTVIVYIYIRTVTSYEVQLATSSALYIRPVIPYQVQLYTASILYIISLKLGYVIAVALSTSSARWF